MASHLEQVPSDGADGVGAQAEALVVTIEAPGMQRADRLALVRWAIDHCPVTDAIARPVPIELDVR
ncbi:MAG TPA: hypothetical protein VET90_03835 [Candidatus Binatus sp.]|nr:hypothetical protein [Candidatus Binatus sp.]